MPMQPLYLKHSLSIKDLPQYLGSQSVARFDNKCVFVGVDLAPVDTLETGVVVIDAKRNILQRDKLDSNEKVMRLLTEISAPENMVVALDLPKSLLIASKWRQQQIKMHPLTLNKDELMGLPAVTKAWYAQRARALFKSARENNQFIFGFFAPHAKLRFGLTTPFRNRSPNGCRALQNNIRQYLNLNGLSENLAPSSVLDAAIGAYSAWLLCHGREKIHYQLYLDDNARLYLDPLHCLEKGTVPAKKKRFRHRYVSPK
ncbi:MAG: hypothetical protein AAGI66_03800 [Cyanobacteria bacterium P01_H01_bin.74]